MQKAEHDRFIINQSRVRRDSVEAKQFIFVSYETLHPNQNIVLRNIFEVDGTS